MFAIATGRSIRCPDGCRYGGRQA